MAKARDRIEDAKPYVKRAIEDEELRENLRSAFATARGVYDELIANRGVTGVATKVATDQEIQDQLRSAIQDLRDAADRIQGNQDHKGRNSIAAPDRDRARPALQPADRARDPALAEGQDLRRGRGVRLRLRRGNGS